MNLVPEDLKKWNGKKKERKKKQGWLVSKRSDAGGQSGTLAVVGTRKIHEITRCDRRTGGPKGCL